jgi:hypothetical protein
MIGAIWAVWGARDLRGARSAGGWRDDPEVAAPSDLARRPAGHTAGRLLHAGGGASGLPNRLGQGDQVVRARYGCLELTEVADELPAAGRREAAGVAVAEVVRVGFGIGGQRADDGGGVRVDVRQGGDG